MSKHDLTTVEGVFGYFAEHTQIFDPIKAEMERLQIENEQLKQENEQLKADKKTLAQNVLDLTNIVEIILTGGIE